MENLHFYLRNKDRQNTYAIYLTARKDKKTFAIYTQCRVKAEEWSKEKQRVLRSNPRYSQINAQLNNFAVWADEFFYDNMRKAIISPSLESWEIYWRKKFNLDKNEIDLYNFYENFISNLDTRQNLQGCTITQSRRKNYERNFSLLKEFNFGRERISFNSFNLSVFEDFINFLTYKKNFSKNYIRQQIKIIKAVFLAAEKQGVEVNNAYKKITVKEEITSHLALTEDELKIIAAWDFSEDIKLDNVRDLFVIGCFTGLRYSDLSRLNKDKFDTFINIIAKKTGKETHVPISEPIIKILNKRNGNLPQKISAVNFNTNIKNVLFQCGINREIEQKQTKGGQRIIESKKAYEIVSSSTARRTFATILYNRNVPLLQICEFTGHSDTKTLLRYINPKPGTAAKTVKSIFDNIL